MTATRSRKGRILVYTNSIGGRPIDATSLADGVVIVYDQVNDIYHYVDLSTIYALVNHTHSQYIEAITKAMVEAVLTGAITSHTHAYEPVFSKNTAFNKNFGTAAGTVSEGNHVHAAYLTAITKAMVEAVLTGAITTHTHSQYLTGITKLMVEAVLTGDITSHSHSIYSLAAHNHDGTYLTAITKAMVEAVLTGNITTHTHSLYPLRGQLSNSDGTNSIIALDTRNANPIPSADLKFGVWFDFKGTSAIGLTGLGQGIWAGVMTLVPYGDDSGNNSAAFRFAHSNQNLFFQGYTGASWLSWRRVLDTSNFIPGTHYQIPITKEIVEGVLTGAITSHTHLYAGSSSAGGAATTALACTGNSATANTLLNQSITVAQANTVTLNPGLYNIENQAFTGLPGSYHYLIQLGAYSGGGYRIQLASPYQNGINESLWIRTAVGTTWNTWIKLIKDDDSRLSDARSASDVYAWAKAATKPAYLYSEVGSARALGRVINDFNHADFRVPGMYGMNNVPANGYGYSYGALIVAANSDTGLQISGGYNHDELHFRGWWSSGAGYGTWRKIWHDGNIATLKTALGTMPASDVYAWAKAASKPTYTNTEVGAAPTTHNHTKAQITDFPTSMPASDVYAWAKAASKPTYTAGEVGAEPSFTKNNAFNKDFGTAAGTVCQGNDSRLSDARTPTDNSVTYAKLNSTLTSRQALVSGALDWSLGGVYTRSLTANTTFTFSNLQLNKTITLVLSGKYTITLPTYCKRISGSYDGSTANYIQLHCTNATGGSEEVWFTISKQAT